MITVVVGAAGWSCAVIGLLGLVLRWRDPRPQLLIVVASGAFLLGVLPFLAVVLLLAVGSWVGAAVAGLVCLGYLAVYARWCVGARAPVGGRSIQVMTQNLLLGQADPHVVVAAVVRGDVDVLLVQELSPTAQDALVAAGLERALPHRWSAPAEGAFGAGIWSRFPLTDERDHAAAVPGTLSATTTLPGGRELTLVCVHPPAPWPRPAALWRTGLLAVRDVLRAVPAGPVVVAGDFNATLDHAPFRHLLVAGYRDAAEQAGAGLLRTWPADRAFPPVIGIDHVLTRGAVATSVRTVRVAGSDHRGLLATVVVAP